jgi:hypothetical protein
MKDKKASPYNKMSGVLSEELLMPFWPPLMGIHGRLTAHLWRKFLLERRHMKAQKTKQL